MARKTNDSVLARQKRPASDRRTRKAVALRRRLVECALNQFEKSGFTRTSIDSITEAADVGKGTFYNYFDSKEALLAAWGRALLRDAAREIEAEAVPDEPALRRLFRLCSALLEPVQKKPGLARAFVLAHLLMTIETPNTAAGHPGDAKATRKKKAVASSSPSPSTPSPSGEKDGDDDPEGPVTVHALVLPIAHAALAQKAVRSDFDADRIAQVFVGVFYQSVMLLATGVNSESPRDHLRGALAVALEGLAPGVE